MTPEHIASLTTESATHTLCRDGGEYRLDTFVDGDVSTRTLSDEEAAEWVRMSGGFAS